ncbi:MAG: hypothetical protein R2867_43825 [Caldilineaceae bacterium]
MGTNVYSVTVTVADAGGLTDSVGIEATVSDVVESTTSPGGVTSGLIHWLRADSGTFSDTAGTNAASAGAEVAYWQNRAQDDLHVTTPAGYTNADLVAGSETSNFNLALDFERNQNDHLRYTGVVLPASTDGTVLAVGSKEATMAGGWATIFGFGSAANKPTLDVDDGADFNGLTPGDSAYQSGRNASLMYTNPWSDGSSPVQFHHGAIAVNEMAIMGINWQHGVTEGMASIFNGENVPGSTTGMEITAPTYPEPNYYIGSDGGGEKWDGLITEQMVYSRQLTAAELQRVQSYLAIRYGITLDDDRVSDAIAQYDYVDSTGAVIWPGLTTNQAYHNDVAGIGRDDASDLEQQKSKSINSGSVVAIDNGGAFAADMSYLVWGNNGQAAGYGVSYSPTSFTPVAGYYHMSRIWKVAETGTVGTVTVLNDTADHLLVDDDGDFTNGGTTEYAMSGGSVTVDFSHGQFFTFGAERTAPGGIAAGLSHWVRADVGVYSDAGSTLATDGQSVQQWNDQSGAGLDLGQATTTQQPIYVAPSARNNFNPALDFTDDFMFNDGRLVQTTDGLTMIAVGDTDVTGGVRTLYASGDNMNDPTMDLDGT